MTKFSGVQHNILYDEMDIHRKYMADFGITEKEAEDTAQSLFSKAYTSNMLATAYSGTTADIIAVVFPCAWSYHDYAKRLKQSYGGTGINDNVRVMKDNDSRMYLFEALE